MVYTPSPSRYASMIYNYCGRSGLKLPALSLGCGTILAGWFAGSCQGHDICRLRCRHYHFDLANNYGPPPDLRRTFGKILANHLKPYRDEIIISTKAGYLMWDGPYGEWGSVNTCSPVSTRVSGAWTRLCGYFLFAPPDPILRLKKPWGLSIRLYVREKHYM